MKKNKNVNKLLIIVVSIVSGLLVISGIFNIYYLTKTNNVEYKNDENIVFFGDSITEQYKIEKFFPKRNIINSGIGGNKTENLIDRLNDDVYKYNPSKVFILIGINDMCSFIDEEDILYNLQTIINGIKINRKYTKLYVESIYPLNHKKMEDSDFEYGRSIKNEDIKKINKKIEKICIESDVTYIDVYSKLIDKDGNLKEMYTKEGLHLNNLGYLKVTSILDDYIYE